MIQQGRPLYLDIHVSIQGPLETNLFYHMVTILNLAAL